MYYRKPFYYEAFSCIADQCPDTCCAGWQIFIDGDSLERYSQAEGEFGIRLLNSIDWRDGAFEQQNRRCSFLNEENLCDLYRELGKDALCETCKNYPRHTEEFEGMRELSLSLSCPAAAAMILGSREKLRLLEEEDEKEETEDFQDFDFLLFGRLEEVRELLFSVVQDRSLPIEKRMVLVLKLADCMQESLDLGRLFEVDFEEKLKGFLQEDRHEKTVGNRFRLLAAMAEDLGELEVLRDQWQELLLRTKKELYGGGEEGYQRIFDGFSKYREERREEWDRYGEQLLMFFLYTYFCGAVYDDAIYSKAVLSVAVTLWIQELLCARWLEKGEFAFEDVVSLSYQCAREIEHSDENLNFLEELFNSAQRYGQEFLARGILEGGMRNE